MNRSFWIPWGAATVVIVSVGAVLVAHSTSVPATAWMHMYDPCAIRTFRDLLTFVGQLRVPIPPLISALEILSCQWTTSTDLVTVHFYRVAIVLTYVLVVWFVYPSRWKLILSALTAIIFLWATVLIHPMNAQGYDIFFPLFTLATLMAWRATVAVRPTNSYLSIPLAACTGLFLSLAELTRPFVIIILPIIVGGIYLSFPHQPRRLVIALLLPVIVLSGIWHLHLWVAYRQIVASNYAGFNLRRAWPMAPLGPTMWETHTEPTNDRSWPNINTEEEYEASELLEGVTVRYWLSEPIEAAKHAVERTVVFARPQVWDDARGASAIAIGIYKIVCPIAFCWFAANVVVAAAFLVNAGRRWWWMVVAPENLLLVVTGVTLLILSLGEAGEEPRLVLSVLPFIATYPSAQRVPRSVP